MGRAQIIQVTGSQPALPCLTQPMALIFSPSLFSRSCLQVAKQRHLQVRPVLEGTGGSDAALRWGNRHPALSKRSPGSALTARLLVCAAGKTGREQSPGGSGGLGLERFGFQSLLDDVPGAGAMVGRRGPFCLPCKEVCAGTSLFPVSRPRPGPRAEILLRGAGLAQGLQAPELERSSLGGYGPSLSLCSHWPPPVPRHRGPEARLRGLPWA